MLSSTVYHFKPEIELIYHTLVGYGYDVLCSHMGTVYNVPGQPPLASCIQAVDDCDFFFGIILPFYGSGITHKEFNRAIAINKPRGFLVHGHVTFAKYMLKQFMYTQQGKRTKFKLKKKTTVIDDLRVIDMYDDAIGAGKPMANRMWAQEFYKYTVDGSPFIISQFADIKRFSRDLKAL